MRPLPLWPLQLVLTAFLQRVMTRNPAIFDRLSGHAQARFGIDPTDLPFCFVIEASPPRLTVVRELPGSLDARISSSLANLLALLEGRVDGDALMFSRELVVEGDVEAVLALRNAIDDAQLDLVSELGTLFGPLRQPVESALGSVRNVVIGSPNRSPEVQSRELW